ncbi:Cof-type HAD-IIB family hydrolase [Kurthia sibirica]|uniref:Cof-type HAD-IIB family hydrolase n=1 Tax=Kurthia sibirica TaxID=202750 RepID=A0A2U3AQG5_9BACL|nr:Cof-type HAD-IIB family hydrolase [Kurthia sibirica]PWI26767.1 Cof-type HAD-IIB family hydrolase [Kurthia sibirica]GEK32700.1 putative phosphatase YkrA [Kurthia sibirica]
MNKKLLFFDIDGTLYNTKKIIPQSAKDAIKAAREQGHEVAIATGRSPFFLKEVSDELEVDSFISFNGQFVVYKGQVISSRPIPLDVLQRLTKKAEENNIPIVYLDEHQMTSATKEHDEVRASMDSLFYPMPEHDAEHYKTTAIYQSLLYISEEQKPAFIEAFPELAFIRWHEFSDDVINHDVSKAYGIEQFIKHTDFTMADVIVFGDGLNDVEMLELVAQEGTSVAMGNAVPQAKEVASIVTDHVDEDGLANAMVKLGLLTK